ncbi:MAG: T9SS type A sorting domain-containing protein [Candidatus Zophobacter franzmannii]|nr:T9SS type A sorting domain-containing protein [Candidatus Zophobacter franzmannii]
MTSTDGVNWTDPVYPFSTAETAGERMLSPALIYNGSDYEVYTVSTVNTVYTIPEVSVLRTYYKRTASSPIGTWSAKTEVDFPLYDGSNWIDPDTYSGDLQYASQIWHMDMLYENNEYWLIASVGNATQPHGGQLWIAKSTNGTTWTFDNNPLLEYETLGWDKWIYRSTAIPYYQNDVMNLKIWYSSDGGTTLDDLKWHIGYTIAYSPDDPVLSVQMSAFYAIYADYRNNINIQWSTESETNVLGFNVFSHSNRDFSQAEMKNGLMIPAENSNQGANYTFVDEHPLDTEDVFYWLEMVSFSGESELYGPTKTSGQDNNGSDNSHGLESGFVGAYPNPFNPQTELAFNLASSSPVTIQVFNIKGELVWEYEPGVLSEGHHTVVFDATKAIGAGSSGIYICKYKDSINTVIKKLVLLK